jgi:sterol desaturase/sphingolipid hydroxylase (fatty acid hydroxylase superfamily)
MLLQHAIHHQDPQKHVRTPLTVVLPVCAIVWFVAGFALMSGLLMGWIVSSLVHWRLHVGDLTAAWVLRLRKHHEGHHQQTNKNYGVVLMVWDRLFGTGISIEQSTS